MQQKATAVSIQPWDVELVYVDVPESSRCQVNFVRLGCPRFNAQTLGELNRPPVRALCIAEAGKQSGTTTGGVLLVFSFTAQW